jgi:hypothetical protein
MLNILKELPEMDPIQLYKDGIPLQSIKICIDLIRNKEELFNERSLAAVLTVVGYAGMMAIPYLGKEGADRMVWGNSGEAFDLEASLENLQANAELGKPVMNGVIPWERIAKAVVDEILSRFGV